MKSKHNLFTAVIAMVLTVATLSIPVFPVGEETPLPVLPEEPGTSAGSTAEVPTPSEEMTVGNVSFNHFHQPVLPTESPATGETPSQGQVSVSPTEPDISDEPSDIPSPTPLPSEDILPTPDTPTEPPEPTVPVEPSEPLPSEEPSVSGIPDEEIFYITMYDVDSDKVVRMPLEEFVLYALAAEMCSNGCPMEALKAQAVAIRSFLIANSALHAKDGYMICNDYTHCMAVMPREEYEKLPQAERDGYLEAAESTKGQILTYNGTVAKTFFHWCSYCSTESALDVFGRDYPYLVPVPTATNEEFLQKKTFTAEELLGRLFDRATAAALIRDGSLAPLGAIKLTDGGRIADVEIYGQKIKGTKLRTALGLRSTDVLIGYAPDTGTFSFTVYGSGHGVGMSQIGAKVMADEGASYSEILYHYYRGTVLSTVNEKHLK